MQPELEDRTFVDAAIMPLWCHLFLYSLLRNGMWIYNGLEVCLTNEKQEKHH